MGVDQEQEEVKLGSSFMTRERRKKEKMYVDEVMDQA